MVYMNKNCLLLNTLVHIIPKSTSDELNLTSVLTANQVVLKQNFAKFLYNFLRNKFRIILYIFSKMRCIAPQRVYFQN